MNYITTKNNRLLNAKKSKQGQVKIDESSTIIQPFICVKVRNKWLWKPFHEISGEKWVKNRDLMRDSIIKTHKDIKRMTLNWQELLISSDEENRKKNQEIKFLFNKLPEYVKNEYLKKFDNQGIKFMHCKVCNDICGLTLDNLWQITPTNDQLFGKNIALREKMGGQEDIDFFFFFN